MNNQEAGFNQDWAEYNDNRTAEAQAWLEANTDVMAEPTNYGERKGYEVPAIEYINVTVESVIDSIAHDEAQCDSYWEFEDTSEDTMLESSGIFNVDGILAHWKGIVQQDKATGHSSGDKFIADKYPAHVKKQAKIKARFNLEFCYNKAGIVRKSLASKSECQTIRVEKIAKKLSKMDRRAAAVAARRARFA